MKKILICLVLVLTCACRQQTIKYYAIFEEAPNLYGKTKVVYDKLVVGYTAAEPVNTQGPQVYVLPVFLYKNAEPMMRTNVFFVASNGILELRICQDIKAMDLQQGAAVRGFRNDWEYQMFLLKRNGSNLLQQLRNLLPDLPN